MDLMQRLAGLLPAKDRKLIQESLQIRFRDPMNKIQGKESFILWEQNLLPEPQIRTLMEEYYGRQLEPVVRPYIPEDVKTFVRSLGNLIPIEVDSAHNKIRVGAPPEMLGRVYARQLGTYEVEEVAITLYDYVKFYTVFYTQPDFIAAYPIRDLFKYVVLEGISEGASDITISEKKDKVECYFNINKRKVYSKRLMPKGMMQDLFNYVTSSSKAATSFTNSGTVYLSMDLDETHRGRVVLNHTYFGWTITIRVLSNRSLDKTLKELNLPENSIGFIRTNITNQTPGLKLFVGPTMSGKNTTILSALYEYWRENDCKIVSVEQPVEIIADFIEQINCDTEEEYAQGCDSLLRQNPDIVYITEMTARTAASALKTANTGKSVFSTLHANSVAEVPSRIKDLTDMSYSQIIQILDCIFFQQLVPKVCPKCGDMGCPECYKAGMVPVIEYFRFSPTQKRELISKDIADIYTTLNSWMNGKTKKDHAMELFSQGVISRRSYENYIGSFNG